MNYNIKKEYYDEYTAFSIEFAKFGEKKALFEQAFAQLVENYQFQDAYSSMHLYDKLVEYFNLDGHLYLFEMYFNQNFDTIESELDEEFEIGLKKSIRKHQNLAMLTLLEKVYQIHENQYWILSRTNIDERKQKSICFRYDSNNIIIIQLPRLED